MTSSVSGSSNASALQQVMLMLQQLAQSNLANPNNTQTSADASAGGVAGAAANTNLVSGLPAMGGDLLVLLQGQNVTPSGPSSAEVGQQDGFGQDFQQLEQAIQSGNLTAAQQAFSTLGQLVTSSDTPNTNSPFLQALNQIGSDLQSGNISGAQQTLSSLQQASAEHHHDGGGAAGTSSSDSSSANASSTVTTEVTSTNPDGSTTTITTYADGSTSTSTAPAPPTQTASANGNSNSLENLLAALNQITI
jgi:hypothetical protein